MWVPGVKEYWAKPVVGATPLLKSMVCVPEMLDLQPSTPQPPREVVTVKPAAWAPVVVISNAVRAVPKDRAIFS